MQSRVIQFVDVCVCVGHGELHRGTRHSESECEPEGS